MRGRVVRRRKWSCYFFNTAKRRNSFLPTISTSSSSLSWKLIASHDELFCEGAQIISCISAGNTED